MRLSFIEAMRQAKDTRNHLEAFKGLGDAYWCTGHQARATWN